MLDRLLFYVAEAALLTIPTAGGWLLLQKAAMPFGYRIRRITRWRLAAVFATFAAFGALTGELIGPQSILQYDVALGTLTVGAASWLASRLVARRRHDPTP